MLEYYSSGTMKKSRSSYPCQDMYMQPSIHFSNRNQNDHKIHQTSGPIQSMERITIFRTRKKNTPKVVGKLLYYARAIDPTMSMVLSYLVAI